MDKLHVLLVCPKAHLFKLVKQTGVLALALHRSGLQVSLLLEGIEESDLAHINPDIKVHYAAAPQSWLQRLRPPITHAIRKLIDNDKTIDIVFMMDLNWPATEIAPIVRRVNIPLVGRLQRRDALPLHHENIYVRHRQKTLLPMIRPLVVSSNVLLEETRKAGILDVVYIAEGVNTEQFKPVLSKRPIRRELGLPEKATLICCMATIRPDNKQLETLERCMPLGENLHLLLIGRVADAEYKTKIQKLAAERGVTDYLHFIDAVPNPEDYLKASDLFVLMGGIEERHTTILEAQSAGLPIALAPSPSSLMLTNGNRCGVVLYPNNPLAQRAFEKLLSDATYRQGRAINTRPHIKKEFSFGRMIEGYIKLFNSL